MFGLFKPKSPVGPKEKAWTEFRMAWLAEKFGMARLLETPMLLPNYQGIPGVSSYEEAQRLLDFLRTWMKVDARNVRLQIHSHAVSPDSIGTYEDDEDEPTIVMIQEDDFEHRDTLVAAMAVGLARQAIVERGLQDELKDDGGWTVELLPVFLGLGVFPANATVKDSYFDNGTWSSWSISRRGNLPSRLFGYALALRAVVRGDRSTEWAASLRQDAQVAFEEGMKYLAKTNDTVFCRESEQQPRHRLTLDELIDELAGGSPSRKISAMWELQQRASQDGDVRNQKVSDQLMDCIRNKAAGVREVAAATLPYYDRSQHAAQDIADALSDSSTEVRSAAALALGSFVGVDDETLVHDLIGALKDDALEVVHNAAGSLRNYGAAAAPATKMLLKRLRRALIACNDDEAMLFMWALTAITEHLEDTLHQYFSESDSEYFRHSMEILHELNSTHS